MSRTRGDDQRYAIHLNPASDSSLDIAFPLSLCPELHEICRKMLRCMRLSNSSRILHSVR